MIVQVLQYFITLMNFVQTGIIYGKISGPLATKGEFPWHAIILTDNGMRCDGALINPNWVLTSASCIGRAKLANIYLGTLNYNDVSHSIKKSSAKMVVHPEYLPSYVFRKNIGLIKLNSQVKKNKFIKPIKIPTFPMILLYNKLVNLSGFGYNAESSITYPKLLRKETLRILPISKDCSKLFWKVSTDDLFCTKLENPKSNQCFGSIGSPLVYNKNGKLFIVGILTAVSGECQIGLSGFQSVIPNKKWIANTIKK